MTKQPQWLDNAVFYEIYPQSLKRMAGTTQITEGVFFKKWGTSFSSYIY